ncbi:unnamed protein product [Candidula unifasciata]|uniref:C2H2-type domain-containing protein n=1 Tax=Candidula unifasciata TaxID=100452 RepID=A0A8S3Z8I9_9EUPU|nr:unnamed protein product [Candidula unifasciata]
MKSSRRKQTTPNRVAAGSGVSDLLGVITMNTSDNGTEGVQISNGSVSIGQLTSSDSSDSEQPLNMHVSTHAWPHCSKAFSNKEELQDHQIDIHRVGGKKLRMEDPVDNFPTVYHRLGHELQESTDLPVTNGHLENELSPVAAAADSTSSPSGTPQTSYLSAAEKPTEELSYSETLQPPPSTPSKMSKEANGEMVNGKSDRIFHMDAYCELCDREFCNKYFLKTHKANKHGIYEDNSPPANNVPLPFPGLMIPQDPLVSLNFSMDSLKPPSSEPLMHWPFKLEPPQHAKKPESPSSVKSTDNSIPLFPMSLPGLESPKALTNKSSSNNYNMGNIANSTSSSISSNYPTSTSILTTITNSIKKEASSSTTPQTNDPSMEDYCHICQKHFCNKYYLKKHKQDVHGIIPENPPSTSNKRSRSSLLDLPPNHMMLPQPFASLAGMHGLPGMPGLPNMSSIPHGMMVINPYSLPPVAIIPAGSLMPGQQLPPHSHPIISQPMSITSLPDSALLPSAPPTSSSASTANSADYSPNRPSPNAQEGGVHCSICSKEFCNEFYLQIHKESKHGMRKEHGDGQWSNSVALLKESRQESPTTTCSITKHEPSTGQKRSPVDSASSGEGSPIFCNLCSKEFTNKYIFRIHRIHDHGLNELMDPMLMGNNGMLHKEDVMRSMNETLMLMTAGASPLNHISNFGLPHLNKPQESAVCDICNKQMANLYFLRLHKFHVHGIDPNANDKCETKPPNSPVLSMSKSITPTSSGSLSVNSASQPLNLAHHHRKSPMLPFLPPKMDFKDMPPFADFGRDFKSYRDVPSFLTETFNHELFARSQSQSRHLDLNFFGLPPLGKLPSDDSLKMNFDPEAYCEICKKGILDAISSSTANINGIKSDAISSSMARGSGSDIIYSMSPLKPTISTSSSSSTSLGAGKSHEMLDKSSWRWKQPINSSRVICDICNKEVCNRYFLRTHKQKKHGIAPSSHSPNVSTSGSPVASDCDTASNASSQPDEKLFRMDTFAPQIMSLPSSERQLEKFRTQSPNFGEEKEDIAFNNNVEQCETCNICNRRFKNLNWLKDHIVKEHSNNEALDMRSKSSHRLYTCQVCGTDFKTELSVQLHLIQEHNARVTLETDEPQVPTEEASLPNGDGNSSKVAELSGRWTLKKKLSTHRRLKKYVCTRCGFDSHWLSSLLDHEMNEHGIISGTDPVFSCKSCHSSLPSSSALSAHLVIVHGFTSEDALHEVNRTEPAVPNNFKCAHCSAVFPTRSWGMAHVRHVHIRSRRDLAVKNSFEKSLLRCPSCPFKTHFSFRLQRHVKYRHRNNLRFPHSVYPSLSSCISTQGSFPKLASVPSTTTASREDSVLGTAIYKSIAASILSVPETGRADASAADRDKLLLHNFKLPLGPGSAEPAPFKFTNQTSVSSAMVGL